MKFFFNLFLFLFLISCTHQEEQPLSETNQAIEPEEKNEIKRTSLVLLGTIQDAGYPQIGCKKKCCVDAFNEETEQREVISLGLIDVPNNNTYLFEATPDIAKQMKRLTRLETKSDKEIVDGIFLTHAHIGHYAGLMYLGKEAMNAQRVPVFTMPRMKLFLEENGPWDQLITNENIIPKELTHGEVIVLSKEIRIRPFLVPHRDEYSETVGYAIHGPNKTALFIPDIDKWDKWDQDIREEIKKVDYAFLDATFYSGEEMDNRDISEIPHPFIIESLALFEEMDEKEKKKIIFIHFNHTNPVIDIESDAAKSVLEAGFRIGQPGEIFEL